MRIITFMMAALAAASLTMASAGTCVISTLNIYDTSGFTCTEGPLTFSKFSFTASGTALPLLTDAGVNVSPQSDGFDFKASFNAPSGTDFDAVIGYTVAVNPGSFFGDQLTMAGFAISGTGAIDIAESVCVGAAFTSSSVCPTGVIKTLHVFDNSGGFVATDIAALSGNPTVLGIIKDISVTGGTGLSAAQVSLVDNLTPFSTGTVPEPATFLLIGAGLVSTAVLRKRLS